MDLDNFKAFITLLDDEMLKEYAGALWFERTRRIPQSATVITSGQTTNTISLNPSLWATSIVDAYAQQSLLNAQTRTNTLAGLAGQFVNIGAITNTGTDKNGQGNV